MKKVLLILLLIVSFLAFGQSKAEAGTDDALFLASINSQRATRGLSELAINTELTSLAVQWSQVMADAGQIFHSDLKTGVTQNWKKLGENVGVGGQASNIAAAFIASPDHLSNIIDPVFNFVGVGIVYKDNVMYVTQKFMQLTETVSKPVPSTSIAIVIPPTIVATTTSTITPTTTEPVPPTTEPGKEVGQPDEPLLKRLYILFQRLLEVIRNWFS